MSRRFKVVTKPGLDLFTIETRQTERGPRDVSIKVSSLSRRARSLSPLSQHMRRQPPIIIPPLASDDPSGSYKISLGDEDVDFEMMDEEFEKPSSKSQNDYMRLWVSEKRLPYLKRILLQKAGPNIDDSCSSCRVGKALWRCLSCVGGEFLCVLCTREKHRTTPFHRVERWNGRYFATGALWQVGVKLYCGHKGDPCPRPTHAYGPSNSRLTVLVARCNEILETVAPSLGKPPEFILKLLLASFDLSQGLARTNDTLREVAYHLDEPKLKLLRTLISMIRAAEIEFERENAFANQSLENEERLPVPPEDIDTPIADLPLADDLNEGIWEEEEEESEARGPVPRLIPRPPKFDSAGNKFITVVDVSGIHHIPVVWCSCSDKSSLDTHDMQLLDLCLYPATYIDISTVFTFDVLDDNRLDNLECKSSLYQYHQKLRRKTSSAFSNYIVNRYPELRRVSRQWRNLKMWKWFGHTQESKPERASMALFCPSCPQPGVNLPPNWKEQAIADPFLFMRSVTADGNFKADHLQQRNKADDVWLTDGEAFMTNRGRYSLHLETAIERKEVPTCNKFRAESNADAAHNGCDVTGVGGHACARHGCFAPGSMVDFHKGKKQMNIDWSLCEMIATTNMEGIEKLGHIYDVGCRYHIHLKARIEENPFLSKPNKLELIAMIGLFHVHGHQDECLYRFATNYVPGAAIVDGEILETLWAVLNLVARSTRTATLAHRTEVLDDHMGDSNFKKMTSIVGSIISKYRKAVKHAAESSKYFFEVSRDVPLADRQEWLHEITTAEDNRHRSIDSMDYMHTTIQTGATLREIETQLINQDINAEKQPGTDGAVAWLVSGLKIEEAQIDLQQHVRRLGRTTTPAKELDLARKRHRLASRIRIFHGLSSNFLGEHTVLQYSRTCDIAPPLDGNISDNELPDAPPPRPIDIENNCLVFPSTVDSNHPQLPLLRAKELELRKGRANDTLQNVRETLGYLSFQFIDKVRTATTSAQNLKSWDGVKLLNRTLSLHRRIYNRCQRAMAKINPKSTEKYPPLLATECKISTAITDVNAPGQSRAMLSWIWGAMDGYSGDTAENVAKDPARMTEFLRIHWLRARAQKERWREELKLTENEMTWSTLFFMFKAAEWERRCQKAMEMRERGMAAFCEQQINMWNEFGRVADSKFSETDYIAKYTAPSEMSKESNYMGVNCN